jgi:hypothetical protein
VQQKTNIAALAKTATPCVFAPFMKTNIQMQARHLSSQVAFADDAVNVRKSVKRWFRWFRWFLKGRPPKKNMRGASSAVKE